MNSSVLDQPGLTLTADQLPDPPLLYPQNFSQRFCTNHRNGPRRDCRDGIPSGDGKLSPMCIADQWLWDYWLWTFLRRSLHRDKYCSFFLRSSSETSALASPSSSSSSHWKPGHVTVNTFRHRQNGWYFTNALLCILIQISQVFVPEGPIDIVIIHTCLALTHWGLVTLYHDAGDLGQHWFR